MNTKNSTTEESQRQNTASSPAGESKNPFENKQSVEQDLARSEEALENEQQFKEAQTERD